MLDPQERVVQIDGEDVIVTRTEARLNFVPIPQADRSVAAASGDTNTIFWRVKGQEDVMFARVILDCEGSNKNADYLPRPALAACFESAKFKPMDVEHLVKEDSSLILTGKTPRGKNSIIGVIVDSQLADSDGNILTAKQLDALDLSDDMSRKASDKLAVVCTIAFWSMLFPKTASDIVKFANRGELSVSMERWITALDWLVRDGDVYKSVAKIDGKKLGIDQKWEKRQFINGSPILRRSLKFIYGGIAVTLNPANAVCAFLDSDSADVPTELTKASLQDPVVNKLTSVIRELREQYVVTSCDADKQGIVDRHLRAVKALATYVGWRNE